MMSRRLSIATLRVALLGALTLATIGASQAHAACVASDTRLCLLNGRFSATLRWNDGTGFKNAYVAGPKTDGASSAAGLFYFYASDSSNWEILTKMIDGCGSNNHFWLLTAASTGFGWELVVKDEANGTTKTFAHPLNGQASGIADFEAFATCGSTPPPTPTPAPTPIPNRCSANGPLTDLRNDCSNYIYLYLSGNRLVGAGLSSDGEVGAVCLVDGTDTICAGGPVRSATEATLITTSANDGPLLPLGAGSFFRLLSSGRTLDVRLVLSNTYDFFGFNYFRTDPLLTTGEADMSLSPDSEQAAGVRSAVQTFLGRATDAREIAGSALQRMDGSK